MIRRHAAVASRYWLRGSQRVCVLVCVLVIDGAFTFHRSNLEEGHCAIAHSFAYSLRLGEVNARSAGLLAVCAAAPHSAGAK